LGLDREQGAFRGSLAVARRRRYKRRNSRQRFLKDEIWRLNAPSRLSSPTRRAQSDGRDQRAVSRRRLICPERIRMTATGETFYAVHKARPFFGELVDFMISALSSSSSRRRKRRLKHRDVMVRPLIQGADGRSAAQQIDR